MNAQHRLCNRQTIEQFLADQLSDEEQGAFEDHLEGCPACRQSLDRMAADGSWWQEARGYLASTMLFSDEGSSSLGSPSPGDEVPDEPLGELQNYLAPTDDPRMLGKLGGYDIVGIIGCGGMGIVLKAFDAPLHRYVAVKVLGPQLASSAAARQRFARETKAAATVVHPNVMAIHAVAEANGLPYFVMPYVRGPSLEKRLQQTGAFGVVEIVRIGMQIAAGLAAAHAQGLVHRDIKPANILLEEGVERVLITDFGLARAVDDASLTSSGVIAGTPQYMSPEQASGQPVDHRSDLFSLGSVLYALCTGRPPFRADTSLAVLRRVEEDRPRPIRELNPDIPEWLAGIVERLQAKEPGDRFQSAAEVAALLERCLAHLQQPTTVPFPQLPSPPAKRRMRSQPRWQTGVVKKLRQLLWLFALVLLAGLGLFLFQIIGAGWGTEQVLLTGTGEGTGRQANEFYHDFRGRPVPPELMLFGDPDGRFVRVEAEGLRITLPKDRDHLLAVGVNTSFGVQGDFEITATLEILHAETPSTGYGVGVGMLVKKEDPSPEQATLCRMVRARDRQVVLWDRSIEVPGGKPKIEEGVTPCTDKVGRLRMKRVGTTLHYLWGRGTTGEDFEEIHQCEFGADDIKRFTLSALTGRQPCKLDVRLLEWRVRSGAPIAQVAETPVASPQKSRWKLWLGGAILALTVTLSLGVWLYVRHGRRTAMIPSVAPGEDKEADLGGDPPAGLSQRSEHVQPTRNAGGATSPSISFPCSECGKNLKAKAELAGKKVKCPHCGKAVRAPESQRNEANQPRHPATDLTLQPPDRPSGGGDRFRKRLWLLPLVFLPILGLGIALWFAGSGPAAGTDPKPETSDPKPETGQEEFYHQFKGNPENQGWELLGPNADQCVQFEPAGLKISLPAGYPGERPSTGLATGMIVKGDFEITMSFEILKEPEPADTGEIGTRLSLGVFLDTPNPNVATLSRSVGAKAGRKVFVTWTSLWNSEIGKAEPRGRTFPTEAKTGRLRLVRTGAVLSFYAAQASDGEFTLLNEVPFGTEDLKDVRIIASTGGPRAALEARVTDLRVRAKALSNPTKTPSATTTSTTQKSRWKLWLAGAIVGLVVLSALGGWLYVWTSRRAGKMPTHTPGDDEVAEPPARLASVSFPCPGCGKTLRTRAERAGKKLKCPHCSEAVLVPETGDSAPTSP